MLSSNSLYCDFGFFFVRDLRDRTKPSEAIMYLGEDALYYVQGGILQGDGGLGGWKTRASFDHVRFT
jgi:hypothetical protein